MRNYLKYVPYAFFILAVLFAIDAIRGWGVDKNATMKLGFALILTLYGLFRMRYNKKFEQYKNQSKNNTDAS